MRKCSGCCRHDLHYRHPAR